MNYEDQIKVLVDTHLTHRAENPSMWPLLDALGCKYVDWTSNGYLQINPKQPDAEQDRLIARTLVKGLSTQSAGDLFRSPENTFSMIQGFCTNRRWEYCLQDEDAAYALCAALAEFCILEPSSNAGKSLRHLVEGEVCTLLNEWINPDTRFDGAPTAYALASAMFGDVWCSIALSDCEKEPWTIAGVIRKQRPPFLPGLVPAQDNVVALRLPPIDTAAVCS